jgi:transposase
MKINPISIASLQNRIAELEQIIIRQSELIEQQAETIVLLNARISDLERRLNKNSTNSSKPPSSDGLAKANRAESLRKKGKMKSGGQPGHKGDTLKQIQSPDIIKNHVLLECTHCHISLSAQSTINVVKRQVFDIPQPSIIVTEHHAETKYCIHCNKNVTATFPGGVNSPVQYGDNIRSFSVYLNQQNFIPEDRLQQLFYDMYGIKIATATLSSYNKTAFDALSEFEQSTLSLIKNASVKNLDETGFRICGKTNWMHVACTDKATYYHASPRRKSLIDGLTGTVVHDHWKPYFLLPDVSHALCNQHHLRELNALIEHEKETWATTMKRVLQVSLRVRHHYGEEEIPATRLGRLELLYDKVVCSGLEYHESLPMLPRKSNRGSVPKRTGHNLLSRFKNYKADILRFLFDPKIPFTNNDAERDIRMVKCKQKISGGFRTMSGANQFARIRGFISTSRKQGWNIMDSIKLIFSGNIPNPI